MRITDFWEGRLPAAASAFKSWGSVSPPTPRAPIWRKCRRDSRGLAAATRASGPVGGGIGALLEKPEGESRGRGRTASCENRCHLTAGSGDNEENPHAKARSLKDGSRPLMSKLR